MKIALLLFVGGCALLAGFRADALTFRPFAASNPGENEAPATGSWYFAVSGDSRDCGDLIMPKIANSIAAKGEQLPLRFYWHLGDFRALYRIDCDMALFMDPSFKCVQGSASPSETAPLKQQYLKAAWPHFIEHAIKPFEQAGIPIYLGIGNHETIGRSRNEFRLEFKKWLTQPTLTAQRKTDAKKHIVSKAGDTYFHFVLQGVDFIYLDNADGKVGFSGEQLSWLAAVLKADVKDTQVKTIIVGMHAALPYSVSSNHAMDESCTALCSGSRAYDMLEQAQNIGGPEAMRKHIYVLASHSHFFEEDIYNTNKHKGHVLPGWIIGTAGAEQYKDNIRYGYMLVEVKPDGTIATSFTDVDRNSPPLISGDAGEKLTKYCFEQNKKPSTTKAAQGCNCNN